MTRGPVPAGVGTGSELETVPPGLVRGSCIDGNGRRTEVVRRGMDPPLPPATHTHLCHLPYVSKVIVKEMERY